MRKLKSRREISLMREAGRVVHRTLVRLREMIRAGMKTIELAEEADRIIAEAGGTALFKGVTHANSRFAFPASICVSINEEVVHGIPGSRVIKNGDLVSIDCGVRLDGYCGDAATTILVGEAPRPARDLSRVTEETLELAIAACKPGRRWSEVAGEMQRHAEQAGFSVVREFVGHGIGSEMHEEPKVPNFVSRELLRNDFTLSPGLVLAVEPMLNAGSRHVLTLEDGWTVVTRDGKPSAHFEHTLAITDSGVEVLTDGS